MQVYPLESAAALKWSVLQTRAPCWSIPERVREYRLRLLLFCVSLILSKPMGFLWRLEADNLRHLEQLPIFRCHGRAEIEGRRPDITGIRENP